MAHIFLHLVHIERSRGEDVTGLKFTIEYKAGQHAEVSILDMPPVSGSAPFDDLRADLALLGRAIQDAAQSPQNITWLPRDPAN
jgi:hypothetical protein